MTHFLVRHPLLKTVALLAGVKLVLTLAGIAVYKEMRARRQQG